MRTRTLISLPLLFALGGACGHADPTPAPAAQGSATPAPLALAPRAPAASPEAEEHAVSHEKFTDGERAFRAIKDALQTSYYASGISEDDLYRAAAEGMLARLDPKMQKWNKLLTPEELAEMDSDLKGEVVGVGLRIHFDPASGYSDVQETVPGSPAEREKLQAGDKILSVDGKLYKGKQARDVVGDIRGRAGDTVTLSVLRDDKVFSVALKREIVPLEVASGIMLPGNVGYVAIRTFNAKTPGALKGALGTLGAARGMVVDLRGNEGGLFEEAVTCAGYFLKPGTPIVRLEKRGQAPETISAKGERLVGDMPLAVLVNGDTSSGAEFVAAALAEGRGAELVGTRTFGKWSVQRLDKLPNGYAMKYTVSLFFAPSGRTYNAEGLMPNVEVTIDEKSAHAVERARASSDPAKRLADDPQLRTAAGLVRARP